MPSIIAEKLDQAAGILAELGIDCWLTFVRETTETGDPVLPLILGQPVTWQSAFIITRANERAAGERIAIVGKYEDQAVAAAGANPGGTGAWTRVLPYVQSIRSPLATTLARLNPPSIAVNFSKDDVKADGLAHGMMLLLREYLAGTPFAERLVSAERIIRALRGRKSASEVQRVRASIATGDEIFAIVARTAQRGMSERAIAELMHAEVDRRGAVTAWERAQCPIVTTGPKSLLGHGEPSSELKIEPGGIFHIDFGVRYQDYCCDMQRCWYVPKAGESAPPLAVQRGFDAVVRAIDAAANALRPGALGWQVDAAARASLINAGYPEYQHATGHNVGRATHDGGAVLGPQWERYGKTPTYPVEIGNVFTLELGIENLDGRGYLGLEEMVLVTERGCEFLTERQRELPLLGSSEGRA